MAMSFDVRNNQAKHARLDNKLEQATKVIADGTVTGINARAYSLVHVDYRVSPPCGTIDRTDYGRATKGCPSPWPATGQTFCCPAIVCSINQSIICADDGDFFIQKFL